MSWKASAWAKEIRICPNGETITKTEKLLLMILADYHHMEWGYASVSHSRLAWESLVSRRHTITIVKELVAKGLITVVMGTQGNQNAYFFPELSTGKGSEATSPPLVKPLHQGSEASSRGVVKSSAGGSEVATSHIQEETRREEKRRPPHSDIWPEEDRWLKEFLDTQNLLEVPDGYLLDYRWWEKVGIVCGGLGQDFLKVEFAKMGAHLAEYPSKRPSTKSGWKRFVRSWLDRGEQWRQERVATKAR